MEEVKQNNIQGESPQPSKFEGLFGKHFKDLVVGLLLLVLIISITVMYCVKDKIDPTVVSLFTSAIMGLIGYFAGNRNSE